MDERRKYKRFSFPLGVQCQPEQPGRVSSVVAGRTVDISLSGAKVCLYERTGLASGDLIRLSIDTFGEVGVVEAEAEVCWAIPCPKAERDEAIGVRFTQMAPSHWENWFSFLPGNNQFM